MRESDINNRYLDWLYDIVCDDHYSRDVSYRRLFRRLHETPFRYVIEMDGNRAEDGVDLRYRFGQENGYADYVVASYLDDRDCSVLEMMIALSLRVETHIMDDPSLGNRVAQWFWEMIVNLGLGGMTDENFDASYVDERLDAFLERDYDRDGTGGLFKIHDPRKNMRSAEIWYQMCCHLNEILEGRA